MATQRSRKKAPAPRTLDFQQVVDAIELADCMITDGGCRDVDSCAVSDLGILIYNKGTPADRLEAFLALVPIARRVYERPEEKEPAK